MNLKLRPASIEDLEWLEPFYEGLMRPYVELTHDWSEIRFRECFEPEKSFIIQANGTDIGFLKYGPTADCCFLNDIQIKQCHQRLGIGSYVLRKVIGWANEDDLPVRLRVLKGNPAIEFYINHGFSEIEALDNCLVMERPSDQVTSRS